MPAVRSLPAVARRIFAAGLAAVDSYQAVSRSLALCDGYLIIGADGGRKIDASRYRRIWVVGAGKAAAHMARACEDKLASNLTGGAVVVKYGHGAPLSKVRLFEAGHPVPDEAGLIASHHICRLLEGAGRGDLVIALISGGGSALLALPAKGISLKDKQRLTDRLLACGASIDEINAVRKHISRTKGGQLARLAAPATVETLVISDVVGDCLATIASGPFAPDPSTYGQALGVLARYGLSQQAPGAIVSHLQRGAAGALPETPKTGEAVFRRVHHHLVATNRLALEAAAAEAEHLGFHTLVLSSVIQGEARELARVWAALLKEEAATGAPLPRPACLLAGGETTVTLRGKGKGGRNTELALAAAIELAGLKRVALLSGATDGTDGPTDAAGAVVDGATCERAERLGLDPRGSLAENDSYTFFERLGELLVTGPTLTNVMDLQVMLAG